MLEKDSHRLQNLLTWQTHEGIFWKWMESILLAKLESVDDTPHPEVAFYDATKLHLCYHAIQNSVQKSDSLRCEIERVCLMKVCN